MTKYIQLSRDRAGFSSLSIAEKCSWRQLSFVSSVTCCSEVPQLAFLKPWTQCPSRLCGSLQQSRIGLVTLYFMIESDGPLCPHRGELTGYFLFIRLSSSRCHCISPPSSLLIMDSTKPAQLVSLCSRSPSLY